MHRSEKKPLVTPIHEGCFEPLVDLLADRPGTTILQSTLPGKDRGRFSFIAAQPFLTFTSYGSKCVWTWNGGQREEFGNPWRILERGLQRYELLDDLNLPFPAGGVFGYCGYRMRFFVEPTLPRKSVTFSEAPDCWFGFHDSLVAHDHHQRTTSIVASGLDLEGGRDPRRADAQTRNWLRLVADSATRSTIEPSQSVPGQIQSSCSRDDFIKAVQRAKNYIRAGDIYQVNLSHEVQLISECPPKQLFFRLNKASPAPFAAMINSGKAQIISSSPELFLKMSSDEVVTCPIKGTRPRGETADDDSRLATELVTSPKERAELLMITDLLRNDLGKVCRYGSVTVPEMFRLEQFAQVQHLVSTVQGRLQPDFTHFSALASVFPGGSVTGAPKIRAMQIIDELESHDRGPYTGIAGYLGFNRESQMSILIRTALCADNVVRFNVGAGIVADSNPEAEYEETWAKADGFMQAIGASRVSVKTGQHRKQSDE